MGINDSLFTPPSIFEIMRKDYEKYEDMKVPSKIFACVSYDWICMILEKYPHKEVAYFSNANGKFPIYEIRVEKKVIGVTMAIVGGPSIKRQFEDIYKMGLNKLYFLGMCASLHKEIPPKTIIISQNAIYDEFNACSAVFNTETINVDLSPEPHRNNAKLLDAVKQTNLKYLEGDIWTTDRYYEKNCMVSFRKNNDEALVVDMETAHIAYTASERLINFTSMSLVSSLVSNGDKEYLEDANDIGNVIDFYFNYALNN